MANAAGDMSLALPLVSLARPRVAMTPGETESVPSGPDSLARPTRGYESHWAAPQDIPPSLQITRQREKSPSIKPKTLTPNCQRQQ